MNRQIAFTLENIDRKKVSELRDFCLDQGLPSGGKKTQLLERVRQFILQHQHNPSDIFRRQPPTPSSSSHHDMSQHRRSPRGSSSSDGGLNHNTNSVQQNAQQVLLNATVNASRTNRPIAQPFNMIGGQPVSSRAVVGLCEVFTTSQEKYSQSWKK